MSLLIGPTPLTVTRVKAAAVTVDPVTASTDTLDVGATCITRTPVAFESH